MKLKLNSWPPGTEDYVNHRVLNEYIQDTSHKTGVHSKTIYNTRVEKVFKSGSVWNVRTSTLTRNKEAFHRAERDWVGLQLPSQYLQLKKLRFSMSSLLRPGITTLVIFQILPALRNGNSNGLIACSIPRVTGTRGDSKTRWVCLSISGRLGLIVEHTDLSCLAECSSGRRGRLVYRYCS